MLNGANGLPQSTPMGLKKILAQKWTIYVCISAYEPGRLFLKVKNPEIRLWSGGFGCGSPICGFLGFYLYMEATLKGRGKSKSYDDT